MTGSVRQVESQLLMKKRVWPEILKMELQYWWKGMEKLIFRVSAVVWSVQKM